MSKISDWASEAHKKDPKRYTMKAGEYIFFVDKDFVPRPAKNALGEKFLDFRIESEDCFYILHQKVETALCRSLKRYLAQDTYSFRLHVDEIDGKLNAYITPIEE